MTWRAGGAAAAATLACSGSSGVALDGGGSDANDGSGQRLVLSGASSPTTSANLRVSCAVCTLGDTRCP